MTYKKPLLQNRKKKHTYANKQTNKKYKSIVKTNKPVNKKKKF